MQYNHFTIEERETIQEMLWQKSSIRTIARELNRNPSSVSREITKNRDGRNRYNPRTSHQRALKKRSRRGREERLKNSAVRQYTADHLKRGWSPEQIAGRIQKGTGQTISHEAIYQYIYAQIHRHGHGYVKPGKEDLRPYLARRRKRRMKKGLQRPHRIDKGPLPSIATRPQEAVKRTAVGHWEDDSLVYTPTCPVRLRTTNELRSGIVFIMRTRDRTMADANRISMEKLCRIPKHLRKTLTRDRGAENMGYKTLEQSLGLRCYFAHAYSSWERGANENLNGLVRRFFPKGTDFRTVSDEEIQQVEYLLNTRPRKRLDFKTPYEVFYELTGINLDQGVALQH